MGLVGVPGSQTRPLSAQPAASPLAHLQRVLVPPSHTAATTDPRHGEDQALSQPPCAEGCGRSVRERDGESAFCSFSVT